ncbi:unnamed protein product [Echinostoma caproni]|uniref:RING-type E3 ubiquitin transferase n=1 Tax=Echinostoma caproni TaxID=27848 RepID=A0A183A3W6_9TREM|nr:unnamed protein product [Echinostoma caproni]
MVCLYWSSFNPDDGLLYPSKVRFHPKSLSRFGEFLLRVCTRLHIVGCSQVGAFNPPQLTSSPETSNAAGDRVEEEIVEVTNFTLINLILRICGPMPEAKTTRTLLWLQVSTVCVCSIRIIRCNSFLEICWMKFPRSFDRMRLHECNEFYRTMEPPFLYLDVLGVLLKTSMFEPLASARGLGSLSSLLTAYAYLYDKE